MKKIIDIIEDAIDGFSGFMLLTLALTLFVAVVARYVFQISLSETAIIQKFSVAWLVFLGSAIAVKDKEHLEIDIFSEYMSEKNVKRKNIVVYVLTLIAIICLVLVGLNAWKAGFIRKELIPVRFLTTRFSLAYYYTSILVGSLGMLFFHILNAKDLFFNKDKEVPKQ